jgi:hypothetical protein
MEISKDAGHRAIVFIRFNPDEYTSKGKKNNLVLGSEWERICAVKDEGEGVGRETHCPQRAG